jgi:hypothetical protein
LELSRVDLKVLNLVVRLAASMVSMTVAPRAALSVERWVVKWEEMMAAQMGVMWVDLRGSLKAEGLVEHSGYLRAAKSDTEMAALKAVRKVPYLVVPMAGLWAALRGNLMAATKVVHLERWMVGMLDVALVATKVVKMEFQTVATRAGMTAEHWAALKAYLTACSWVASTADPKVPRWVVRKAGGMADNSVCSSVVQMAAHSVVPKEICSVANWEHSKVEHSAAPKANNWVVCLAELMELQWAAATVFHLVV